MPYTISKHFAPSLKAALPFTSKDKRRAVLANVFVEKGHVYATDGHKMIRFNVDLLGQPVADGTWAVVKLPGSELMLVEAAGQAPNFEAVMPKRWSKQFSAFTGSTEGNGVLIANLGKLNIFMRTDQVEALPSETWTVGTDQERGPVILFNDRFTCVLMPMRHDATTIEEGAFKRETLQEAVTAQSSPVGA